MSIAKVTGQDIEQNTSKENSMWKYWIKEVIVIESKHSPVTQWNSTLAALQEEGIVTYLSSTAQMSLFTSTYSVNVDPEGIFLFFKDFKIMPQSFFWQVYQ